MLANSAVEESTAHTLAVGSEATIKYRTAENQGSLDATIPATRANYLNRRIDLSRPEATLLLNPSANLNYGALINGPGTTSSIAASLSQDFAAVITCHARVRSAEDHLYQVDANQLWREWQVAQKARQLALDIYSANRSIGLTDHERQLFSRDVGQVRTAIAEGNLMYRNPRRMCGDASSGAGR